ncbi:glycosyltransferase family protein [Vibrio bivalvicida]|uniref:Glycosyl transferase family 28 C-terminal domain-containing protein n=1 Tax=Vibrio bivalvicida TaxID=1276888 RepID=A0A177XXE7_9VIBR|nr:glycosyltransferase [Vibrio bivalvicida]OAJ93274.1 hypothetical protein APB76_15030 [Vibrio bivalvicida]
MKKLLFYSHDSYGLGNIRRMVAIANELVSRHSDLYILLITGSPMLHAFRTHPQIDYVKLPCLQRSKSGRYSAKLACYSAEQLVQSRSAVIHQIVASYKPDLLLVDKKPEGLNGELKQTLLFLSSQHKSPRCVLLLRDILDSPQVTQHIWQKNGYYQLVEKYYDQVLVVGEQKIFDVTAEYRFPSSIAQKTQFCGYLQRTEQPDERNQVQNGLASTDRKLIVAAAGGGDDGSLVLTTYLQALAQSAWGHQVNTVVFYGPEMNDAGVEQLRHLASSMPHVTLLEFTPHFISYLSAADLVVAMGGYNTICEILSVKKPAIIVPRVTPVAEQLLRAQCFSRLEIFECIHPNELTPSVLGKKIANKLFSQEALLPFPDKIHLNGMEKLDRLLVAQKTN